jgi:hypothetical protein
MNEKIFSLLELQHQFIAGVAETADGILILCVGIHLHTTIISGMTSHTVNLLKPQCCGITDTLILT